MKKDLYFDKTWQLKHLSIEIINGKIRKYHGGNFTPAILFGGSVPLKTFELKSDFTLEKIHRYDRKNSGIHANYRIECPELLQKLLKPCYIRLNPIEKFIIDYSKKESFIQKAEIKKMIVVSLIVTIPTSILTTFLVNQLQVNKENTYKVATEVKIDTTTVTKTKIK
jgi:hypothetical protein